MGPPLMDAKWIYGGEPVQIFDSIVNGRPNGIIRGVEDGAEGHGIRGFAKAEQHRGDAAVLARDHQHLPPRPCDSRWS